MCRVESWRGGCFFINIPAMPTTTPSLGGRAASTLGDANSTIQSAQREWGSFPDPLDHHWGEVTLQGDRVGRSLGG